MRLTTTILNQPIEFKENNFPIINFENQSFLQEYFIKLKEFCNGDNDEFVLSDNNEVINPKDKITIISDFFSLDELLKSLNSKVLKYISTISDFDLEFLKTETFEKMFKLMQELELKLPFDIEYEVDETWTKLLKFTNVRIENSRESLLEKLLNTIDIINIVSHEQLIIFFNAHSILNNEQLAEVYKFCNYKKIFLLQIESNLKDYSKLEGEDFITVDKDLCIINKNLF